MSSWGKIRAVRPATERDADELARLLTVLGHTTAAEAVVARWGEWAAAGNAALVAPCADGGLAGAVTLHCMIVLHRPKPVGRITALVVDIPQRRQGLGRALVAAAEEALSQAGCGLLEVTSHARHTDIYPFYEHLGFERTSARFAKTLGSPG